MPGQGHSSTPSSVAALLDQVAAFVDARLPCWHAPGVVVGVTDRERTLGVAAHGWADLAAGRVMAPSDRFQIGSISKSFAAMILLQEVDAGHIDLHAPVTDYVPWFSVRSPFAPITVHHLLTHTSGLATGTEAIPDARHALWSLRDFTCTYPPGERFLYSNDGYKLIGVALEEVTGTPFPELLAERLLGPLGMRDSAPMITLAMRATAATPHQRLFDDRPRHAGHPLVPGPWYESASADGSIVSTAEDMCAYARLLLNAGEGPGGRVLSGHAFRLLTARQVEDPTEADAWYGYGLEVYEAGGRPLIGHSGGMLGFSSYLMIDPGAGLGVVVLMNGNEDRRDLVDYVLAVGRAAAAGHAVPPAPPPADARDLGAVAQEYAGVYTPCQGTGSSGSLTLVAEGGRLVLRRARADVVPERAGTDVVLERAGTDVVPERAGTDVVLERAGDDVFLVPHQDLDRFALRFWRDAAGRIAYVTHGPDWYPGPAYGGPATFPSLPDAAEVCGHYQCWDPWMSHLRIVARRGALWLIAPWVQAPGGEVELVPLGDGRYRVGREEWRPERLALDTVIGGKATRATYDFLSFYRAATP